MYVDPFPLFGPQDRTDYAAEYYAIAARLRLRWLSHYAPTGRLLEIGCGRGDFLHAAHEAGYSVAAVEPNAAHLRELRTWTPSSCTPAFFTRIDLPPERFDVVFHVDLMSHFVDPLDALRTMRRATRPGGVVAFEVGLLAGVSPRWYKWQRAVGYAASLAVFTKAIYCLLEKAGLRPIATQQFGLLPETLPPALAAGAPLAANKEDNSRSGSRQTFRPSQPSASTICSSTSYSACGMEPVAGHPSWVPRRRSSQHDAFSRLC